MFKKLITKDAREKKTYLVVLSVLALGIIMYITSGTENHLFDNNLVRRGEIGEIDDYVSLNIHIGDDDYSDVEVQVSSQHHTVQQLDAMFAECKQVLYESLLTKGNTVDNVTSSLNFVSSLKGYPFKITWEVANPEYIDENGELTCFETVNTHVTAIFKSDSWSRELVIPLVLSPDAEAQKRWQERLFVQELLKEDESQITGEYLALPQNWNGKPITYAENTGRKNPIFLFLGMVAAVLVLYASKMDRKKEKQKEIDAIVKEYPTMIHKMVMYLASGMTLRNVWIKLSDTQVENPSFLTCQMQITSNEISAGVPEITAYEHFGERIGAPELIRFAALLSQNLKRGSTNLNELLAGEMEKAFTQQKNQAIKKAEEAGTKLLLPMMLLLLVVLLVIMVPAFMTL